jgi:hypothetical protein
MISNNTIFRCVKKYLWFFFWGGGGHKAIFKNETLLQEKNYFHFKVLNSRKDLYLNKM